MANPKTRWEQGRPHWYESEELVRQVNKLDKNDELGLDLGGVGDPNDSLA